MKKNMNPLAIALSMGAIAVTIPHQVSAWENITGEGNNETMTLNDRNQNIRADRSLRKEQLMKKLDLNASQKAKMQAIRSKYKPQVEGLRENITSERSKLSQMMQENRSESELRRQHQKIVDIDRKIHNLRFEIMLEMREILTTEQRQKWAESMAEIQANRRGRFR